MTEKIIKAKLGPDPLAIPPLPPKYQDRRPEYADANGNPVIAIPQVHVVQTESFVQQPAPQPIPKEDHYPDMIFELCLFCLLAMSVYLNFLQRRKYNAREVEYEWQRNSRGSIRDVIRNCQDVDGGTEPDDQRSDRPRDWHDQSADRQSAKHPRRMVYRRRYGIVPQDHPFHPEGSPLEAIARAIQLARRTETGS